jgi:protein ImuB
MRHDRSLRLGEGGFQRATATGQLSLGGSPVEQAVSPGLRVLALYVPSLPLQRFARLREPAVGPGLRLGEPLADPRPVAVADEGRVVACDAAAREAGVRAGQTLAEALSACGRLLVVPHAPAADLAALRGLAEALLAIAPAVEVAAPDALLLDASAAHLLGGGPRLGSAEEPELRLAARARSIAAGLGYAVRAAVATGRGPARALARHGAADLLRVPPGEDVRALSPLPLAALGLGPAVEERLRTVGVADVGGLARLPAEGLALRFGQAGAAAARLARGEDATRLVPYVPETLPEEAIELEGPAESVEPVLFVLARLAERVAARLAGRSLGASRLTLTLKLDPRGEERLSLPLAQASATAARWLAPLRERLLLLRLPGAVTGVKLTAVEVARLAEAQLAFGDRPEVATALDAVLARLSGRLGEGAVLAAEPVERYRPEAAWRTVPFRPPRAGAGGFLDEGAEAEEVVEMGARPTGSGSGQRPTRLLTTPQLVVATGEGGRVTALRLGARAHAVRSFEGPERIAGEWWSAPFDRDYYRASVEGLGDCWIYRDGADGRLWLHGFFD